MTESTSRSPGRPDNRIAWGLFFLALVVRVVSIVFRDLGDPIPVGTDAVSYDAFARAILRGTGWIFHPGPELFRPPGYPFVLAFEYALFGGQMAWVQISQAVVGAASVLLLYRFGRRHVGASAAFLAALWLAVNPLHLDFAGKILRENWLVLLNIAFIASMLAPDALATRGLIRSGLLFTILMHFDSRYVFHLPFLALYVALAMRPARWSAAIRPAAILLATVLVASAPWAIRNAIAYDRFVVIDPRVLDRWAAKAQGERVSGVGEFGSLAEFEAMKEAKLDSLTSEERAAYKAGIRPKSGQPAKAIFNLVEFWRIAQFTPEYRPLPDGRFAGPWSAEHNLSSLLFMGLLIPLALLGAWRGIRAGEPFTLVIVAFIIVHTLLHVAVHSVTRYRLPIEPFVALLAFREVVLRLPERRRVPA